jgi:RNA polymerase sigma-70 factor (ECF subfamily)
MAANAEFLSEGAVKVAVHRLRRRFRELVKKELLHTVNDPTAVPEELRYLVEVLCR